MQKLLCALPLSLFIAAACGPPPTDLELAWMEGEHDAIINGQACAADELDTAVAILVDADVDFWGMLETIKTVVCTGTLIAPDVVLAAAHCMDPEAMTMGFGTVTRESYSISFTHDLAALAEQTSTTFPDDAVEAVDWATHPEFSMDSMTNVNGPGDYHDVGLLFLASAVTHIRPEVVVTSDEAAQLAEGKEVRIAGWGQQTQTASPMDPPPPGTVGIKRCATSFINELGDWEMQIGGDASTSRKCHGDSGGPSYLEVETEHARTRRVVGITSHSYDETDCAKGGVDTRVDAWLQWINDQMRRACDDGTRTWCEERGIVPPGFYDPVEPDPNEPGSGGDVDGRHEVGCLGCAAGPGGHLGAGLPLLFLGLLALRRRRAG